MAEGFPTEAAAAEDPLGRAFGSGGDGPAAAPATPPPGPANGATGATRSGRSTLERLFGSPAFFRLWLAQVVSSTGDWIGFVAVTAIAARVGGRSSDAAVGFVLSARLLPGFFFGSAAGVLVDRWDRKKVMVACDVGRGLVLATLPFVDTVPGLFLASLLLEVLTLLWAPAKEASAPHLVPSGFLANANSLSLIAAYGTFPVGSAIFAALAGVATWLGHYDALQGLRVSQETVAIWFDVTTFFASALIISSLPLPARPKVARREGRSDLNRTLDELREGWRFIGSNRCVRAVIFGLATGLIGGGMLVPLGPRFAERVLGAGTAGFGLLITALGFGVATGVILLTVVQSRVPHERVFVLAVLVAGVSLLVGATTSSLAPAMVCVGALGLAAGAVYVLGFTILQTTVDDELRGRVFATLFTLVRLCLLLAFAVAPWISSLLDRLSRHFGDQVLRIGAARLAIPGVRLTLWIGGLIIVAAGLLAARALRPVLREERSSGAA